MTTCVNCRTDLIPGARYCPRCGLQALTDDPPAPDPSFDRTAWLTPAVGLPAARPDRVRWSWGPRHTRVVVVALAASVLLGGLGGGAWLLTGGTLASSQGELPGPPSTSVAVPTIQALDEPSSTAGGEPTAVPTPAAAPNPSAALVQRAVADRARAEAAVGRWIPQISAKAAGLRIDGISYDDSRIWDEFQKTATKYPTTILVSSSDYTTFRQRGYWVVLVAQPHASAAAANGWCSRQGYAINDCFAKRLSHTASATGNTVLRKR